jgi:site-specific DNA recombinase
MLNEFIEKILVHERDRKGSIQTTQEVEIYFNFVGRFVPTTFGEVELIVRSLAKQNGVTEQLKAENQMEWVRQMNACKAQAEEVVKAELIYN